MSDLYVKKNGLLYSEDMQMVIGIDSSSTDFTGRVPFGAHAIADDAFAACELESISLPDSVKELPPCLFENSANLTKVKLPSGLEEIPPYLFSGCTSLTKVTMPDIVTAFPEGLFYGCTSLQEVPFRAGIQELPENVLAGCTSLKSLVIPNTVAKISTHAFKDCTALETIVFPAKMYELADDAFEGCTALRTIRIDSDNHLFYVNEQDGCLYEKSIDGEDKCRLRISDFEKAEVSFINENFNDEVGDDKDLTFVSSDELEDEETLSSDVQNISKNEEELIMGTENINNDVDSIFADIMNAEKERTSGAGSVAVSAQETQVLSEVMEVMADSHTHNSGQVSMAELENLFASNESSEAAGKDDLTDPLEPVLDSKTKALIESAGFTNVMEFETQDSSRSDSDLFVIAEKIIEEPNGKVYFSPKLEECVKKMARIQDYKRVIMLYGLPVDNDEFMQFFFFYMNKRNVVIACEAKGPSELSDYCKLLCEQSRISLEKEALLEQRKRVSIKNDSLVKLIIQDVYN